MRITQLLGLLLLGVSIALEVVTNVVRFVFFVFVLLTISYRLPSMWLALLILGWPVIAALATLVGWPGGALMRWEYGARRPSTRERASVDAAAARLGRDGVRLPRRWYVIDAPITNASVVGSTLFVTRELVNSPFLDGVLAHELGHLNSIDARIGLALLRIPYPGPAWIARQLEDAELTWMAFWWRVLVAGGQGQRIWPISALWSWYWRRREYSADRFAANLGAGDDLIGYLEDYPLAVDTATPFMRNMTHPFVEHRLDRLMKRGASAIAGG